MRSREQLATCRAGLFALATLSLISCTGSPPSTRATAQPVISAPLPSNLNLTLNATTTVTIGLFAQVFGDVGSAGLDGSVVFDVNSSQGGGGNVLANTVRVRASASVGHIFGNDITVAGVAAQQTLGLDPTALPFVPGLLATAPGTTNVAVAATQTKQLCPGQYGVISLGPNSTLNLNGGVYHLSRLILADGAKLQPSEPVVLVVSGDVTAGTGAIIAPYPQVVNPMSAGDIRLEVGGNVAIGDGSQVHAHLLVPDGELATGTAASLTGAAWAQSIAIGAQSVVTGEGAFSAQTPSVPPPCNDNNACTVDQCVSNGATAFCRNTPVESCGGSQCGNAIVEPGEECDDGNVIDGDGCNANCTVPRCGNGILDPGEQCDDGNFINGDGCDVNCTVTRCGNGILDPGEQCDDGNLFDGDGCSSRCTIPRCGDGFVDLGEQCDDGNVFDGDGCSSHCTIPRCGDGFVDPGEECDDGNVIDGDGCSSHCTLARCGNGVLDPGEEADPPVSPSQVVPVSDQTCRFDFSAISQLYCAGSCGTWGGSGGDGGCGQGDADAFCKLKTGNPNSRAMSFGIEVARAAPGICCPTVTGLGCTELGVFADRGVVERVSVHETNLLGTHGPGSVITNPVCTP